MPQSVLSKFSNLLLTIYQLAQDTPAQAFQDALLVALKTGIPFDSSMWGTATMTTQGIDVHSIHLHQSSQAMLTAYEAVKHQDSPAQRLMLRTTTTLAFNSAIEFAGPDKAGMRDLCETFGHRHGLITCDINPHTKFVQWVSLFRHDVTQVCTDEEIEILSNLAPHLMQALAMNRLIHLDKLVGDVARERWSVAIADTRGVIYHAGADFWELMAAEWTVNDHRCLPGALLDGLLLNKQMVGRHTVVHCTLAHELMYLKARRREKVDSLSAREYLVAKLSASGLSQKEVATRVGRSPETIRSQMRTVFDKLGINNVVMLAPHLALRV